MINFNGEVCICGCGQRAGQLHHVVYQQELRWHDEHEHPQLRSDPRNMVLVAYGCHVAHHDRSRPLSLDVLPDPVFSFAAEVLGVGAAYEYLRRRYAGEDVRLELLKAAAA